MVEARREPAGFVLPRSSESLHTAARNSYKRTALERRPCRRVRWLADSVALRRVPPRSPRSPAPGSRALCAECSRRRSLGSTSLTIFRDYPPGRTIIHSVAILEQVLFSNL